MTLSFRIPSIMKGCNCTQDNCLCIFWPQNYKKNILYNKKHLENIYIVHFNMNTVYLQRKYFFTRACQHQYQPYANQKKKEIYFV